MTNFRTTTALICYDIFTYETGYSGNSKFTVTSDVNYDPLLHVGNLPE